MTKPLNFQQIIMTLQQYWADHGALIWQPWHETVGAGTNNPGTALRVLGPEPWDIAYVEPSFRPDDGRFGENPNRMQMFYQFQVILQPDPGNPQELYLASLYALGLNRDEHDIRFVEDNWESPALGAWGLGWEVWLDGMEISQYTYFQQSGGFQLDPVAVELTYGLERIAMYLQKVNSVWEIDWDGRQTYGDILLRQEIEYCEYNFNVADIEGLKESYNFYETECHRCLERGLVTLAHDYVLKCSHTFNILDTRGAIGVTERAGYFARMRRMSHQVAKAFVQQREQLGFPLMKYMPERLTPERRQEAAISQSDSSHSFLLEIGSEELPYGDVTDALTYLREAAPKFLADLRLAHGQIQVVGSPRRLAILVEDLAPRQEDLEEVVRGPSAKVAFDAEGQPTKAAQGFARSRGVDVSALEVKEMDGGQYVVAMVRTAGRPAAEVLSEALPDLIRTIPFGRSMRWLASAQVGEQVAKTTFSRPIRWLVALLGNRVIPFEYAGLASGRTTRGLRPEGSPEIEIAGAAAYLELMHAHRIIVEPGARQAEIKRQLEETAARVGGQTPDDPALLEEVTNLVEQPTAFLGSFEEKYLALPEPVLITVMKKHQRYFPLVRDGKLLPHFIGVRNGGTKNLDIVRQGNEGVLRARYADAEFFFKADTAQPLEAFLPRLDTLTFQEQLGSMLDKSKRLELLAPQIGERLQLPAAEIKVVERAAHLSKADLATNMVVELTSLQGIMGYEYAKIGGEPEAVAAAIVEHYYPQAPLPHPILSRPGLALNLANRLDSLCGLFAVGKAPSGSADPFALRRDALSLVTILLETETSFSVSEGLNLAAALMPVAVSSQSLVETAEFIQRRLEGLLRDEYHLPHDVVQAVLAEQGDNPWKALTTASALAAAVTQPGWQDILNAYARCVRIVRTVEERYTVQPDRFTETVEKALYIAYQQTRASLTPASPISAVIAALREILVEPINAFFDGVLVMAEDESVRQNRLALLQDIRDLTKGYADFSRLQGF
jgi:glycyl-tRNA synthetase